MKKRKHDLFTHKFTYALRDTTLKSLACKHGNAFIEVHARYFRLTEDGAPAGHGRVSINVEEILRGVPHSGSVVSDGSFSRKLPHSLFLQPTRTGISGALTRRHVPW